MAQVLRTDVINRLIRQFGYLRYLEIGVGDPYENFDCVIAPYKDGVDPFPKGPCRFEMTSDEFFERIQPERRVRYDLVFVDGLHLNEQALRDVEHALDWLKPGGTIVVHDCNPPAESFQTEEFDGVSEWNGTVWKAFARLRTSRPDLFMLTVDTDWGVGVVQRGSQVPFALGDDDVLDYFFLERNRSALLNLMSPADFFDRLGTLPAARMRAHVFRATYGNAHRTVSRAWRRLGVGGDGSSPRT